MANYIFSWNKFYKLPIIGIVRNFSMEELQGVLPVFRDAGLNTIEITMNTKGACKMIQYIRKHFTGLNVGAGTVCTKKELAKAIHAGAQFIVTPVPNKKIIKECVRQHLPVFPGAFTPTEIYKAWKWGAAMVKLYPAKLLGADYIKDIKAPLNQIKLLPTGGVGAEDIAIYKKAGADGFGIGSPLFAKHLVTAKDWNGLSQHFAIFVNQLREAPISLN